MSELEGSREYVNHELVAEIFHFLPNEVTEFMYDSLNEIVYNVMEGINLRILELKPDKEVELTETMRNLETETEIRIDKLFNAFQKYVLNSLWKIPSDLDVRPQYLNGIDLKLTQEHDDFLNSNLDQIRKSLIAQKKLQYFLNKNLEETQIELNTVNDYSKHLSFFTTIPEKHNVRDVESSTRYVKTNLDRVLEAVHQGIKEYMEKAGTMDHDEQTKLMKSQTQFMRSFLIHFIEQNKNK